MTFDTISAAPETSRWMVALAWSGGYLAVGIFVSFFAYASQRYEALRRGGSVDNATLTTTLILFLWPVAVVLILIIVLIVSLMRIADLTAVWMALRARKKEDQR